MNIDYKTEIKTEIQPDKKLGSVTTYSKLIKSFDSFNWNCFKKKLEEVTVIVENKKVSAILRAYEVWAIMGGGIYSYIGIHKERFKKWKE